MDLIRHLTTNHREMYYMYLRYHRSKVLRLLYNNKIHLKPNKIKIDRFKDICNLVISSYDITSYNNIMLINAIQEKMIPLIRTDCIKVIEHQISKEDYRYEYNIGYIGARYLSNRSKMFLPCYMSLEGRTLNMFVVNINIWEYIFMVLHSYPKFHLYFFADMNNEMKDMYFKMLKQYNITNEKSITTKFYEDCRNASLEYMNMCILKENLIH